MRFVLSTIFQHLCKAIIPTLVLALSVCHHAQAPQEYASKTPGTEARPAPPTNERLIAEVEAHIAKRLSEPGGVGLSIAIARSGQVILSKAYGFADLEHQIKADENTRFRIASVTKQFTAAGILRLVERGELRLDDDIANFFPDLPTQGHVVRIQNLLSHTSGIMNYTAVKDYWATGANRDLSTEELLAYLKDETLEFEPGTSFKYCNTGYYMLGVIVERISGMSYGEFLQQEFFIPLNLQATRADSTADIIPNRAQGYMFERGRLFNDPPLSPSNFGGAGIIISTAGELLRWQMALLGGELLEPESLERMLASTILTNGESTGYGLGINPGSFQGHPTISHSGGVFGFTALLVHFPNDDLTIAVLSNVYGGLQAQALGREIASLAFGTHESVLELTPSDHVLGRCSGLYTVGPNNKEVSIFTRGGQLFMQPSGRSPMRLLYQGEGEFRVSNDTGLKLFFDLETATDFTLQQGSSYKTGHRLNFVDLQPTPKEIESFTGLFLLERVNIKVEVTEFDGYLYLKPDGREPARLLYQGHGELRAQEDLATKILFDPENPTDLSLHENGGRVAGVRQAGG